jgi:hypothetical protein
VNCAIATDATLSGRAASAMPGGPYRIDVLEKFYGAKFVRIDGIRGVSAAMGEAGNGARGIVFGSRGEGEVGHVFNVVNRRGTIRYLDGQTGKAASLDGYDNFHLFRTN